MSAALILGWLLLAATVAAAWALLHIWLRFRVAQLRAEEQRAVNALEALRTALINRRFDAIVAAEYPHIPAPRTEEPS